MRIIGGSAGGTTLKVPKGLGVRPTPDKVRLAIFNSLGKSIDNSRVLELFAEQLFGSLTRPAVKQARGLPLRPEPTDRVVTSVGSPAFSRGPERVPKQF